jgi:hypothetical protein
MYGLRHRRPLLPSTMYGTSIQTTSHYLAQVPAIALGAGASRRQ